MSHGEDNAARIDRGLEPTAAAEPGSEPQDAIGPSAQGSGPDDRALHPKLRALLGGAGPDRPRIQHFLSRNRFPLVEREAVTFLFHGEADAVYFRHFMSGLPNGVPFVRVSGTDLWHLRLPLPEGTRFEYKFDVVRNGESAWINDPHNPCLATDPFGANSVGHSFGYAPPPWTRPDADVPVGRVEEIAVESRAFAGTRCLRVYIPAGFADDRAYPLVVVHDGEDFLAHAELTAALDNLLHRGEVPPFIAALTQPGERNVEYTDHPRHADFLTGEVLPALRERFPLLPDPNGTVLMGASLGAVAALSTAYRHPGVYGALALKSASFTFDRKLLQARDPLFTRIADFVDRLRAEPRQLPARAYVGCGVHEGLIGQNRVLARFLREHGVDLRFIETRDAHHWQNWRDQLRDSLRWTLPGGP